MSATRPSSVHAPGASARNANRPSSSTRVRTSFVPLRAASEAAHYAADFADAAGYGWSAADPRFDWEVLKANRAREIARLNGIYEGLLRSAGATLLRGRARLAGPGAVEVGGVLHRTRHVLVATGGHPVAPDLPGAEYHDLHGGAIVAVEQKVQWLFS